MKPAGRQVLTELLEKEERLPVALGAVPSQPWVAFAKQGCLLIKMFNYNSVIEDGKEHLGVSSTPNNKNRSKNGFALIFQKETVPRAVPSRQTLSILLNRKDFWGEHKNDCMYIPWN